MTAWAARRARTPRPRARRGKPVRSGLSRPARARARRRASRVDRVSKGAIISTGSERGGLFSGAPAWDIADEVVRRKDILPAARSTVVFLALASALAAGAAPAATLPPGDHALTLDTAGGVRYYQVHLPASARAPTPIVLVFHGGGSRGSAMKRYSRLDALADTEGFATVYPDGSGQLERLILTWNAGFCCGYARRMAVDDVGFVARLLDELEGELAVDRRRVYATGFSNGAMLVHRLALELPDRLAAVAPVAGALLPPGDTAPAQPVPLLHVHSVDDPRAPYDGGLGPPSPVTEVRTPHPAVSDVLARWAEIEGCSGGPELTASRRDSGGHRAEHWVWSGCARGAALEHWKLFGPGHVWPGASPFTPSVYGEATRILDVNRAIWDFFERFTLASR